MMIIAKIENEEKKREVMYNRSKLRGEKIYIDHDLTWEKRKRQEEIGKWAKKERGKGKDVKVGFGRVNMNGIWRKWEKVEKDMGQVSREEAQEKETHKEVGEQNFV